MWMRRKMHMDYSSIKVQNLFYYASHPIIPRREKFLNSPQAHPIMMDNLQKSSKDKRNIWELDTILPFQHQGMLSHSLVRNTGENPFRTIEVHLTLSGHFQGKPPFSPAAIQWQPRWKEPLETTKSTTSPSPTSNSIPPCRGHSPPLNLYLHLVQQWCSAEAKKNYHEIST